MITCPACGSEVKEIPAGVSKKTGRPYEAFQICSNNDCNWKPQDGKKLVMSARDGTVKTSIGYKPTNGHNADMRLAYRKDLMVALVSKWTDVTNQTGLAEIFNFLWSEVEK